MIVHIETPRVVKFVETESRSVVAKDWGKWGVASCCLMGIEVLVLQDEMSVAGWLHNNVNGLSISELCT